MIKMFIGSSSNGEDAGIECVYEYSLRKHATDDIEIVWMRQTPDENNFWYNDATIHWSTPFSGYRWFIPEYCNFKGRAIYTDCDMINLHDIKELWDTPLDGKPIGARRGQRFGGHEFCVMLIDCAAMEDHVVPIRRQKHNTEFHHRMIKKFSGNSDLVKDIDPRWNCLDGEDFGIGEIKQLHYTNMATQPWRPEWYNGPQKEHPREDIKQLYYDWLDEAVGEGFIPTPPEKVIDNYAIIGR